MGRWFTSTYVSFVISDLFVNVVISQNFVDLSQYSRNIVMDVDDLQPSVKVVYSIFMRPTRAWFDSSSVRERRLTSGKFTAPRVTPEFT